MTPIEDGIAQIAQGWRTFRAMPAQQLLLRGGLLIAGIAALLLPIPSWPSGPGIFAVIGALVLVAAVIAPGGIGPSVVIGIACVEWIMGYGWERDPNHYLTVVLAAMLYLVHTVGALCAAIPPTARYDRHLLARWFTSSGLVLIGLLVIAAVVYGIGEIPGSLQLELVGLLGVLLVVAVPVWMARRIDR